MRFLLDHKNKIVFLFIIQIAAIFHELYHYFNCPKGGEWVVGFGYLKGEWLLGGITFCQVPSQSSELTAYIISFSIIILLTYLVFFRRYGQKDRRSRKTNP